MKPFVICVTIVFSLIVNLRADAGSILYNTTDIGRSYQILESSGGQAYGVVGSTGVTYAFDKSPVTSINLHTFNDNYSVQTTLTMQSGPYQVGYTTETGDSGHFLHPSFDSYSYTWYNTFGSPVSDLNIKGQAVGTSLNPFGPYGNFASPGNTETYAAFSALGLQLHDPSASSYVVDNLNNYIATIPGGYLDSAIAIDDLGRIVTEGDDGQFYLLTPVALGAASTVPEPTTLLMFGVVGSLIGLRSLSRRAQGFNIPV